MLARILDPSSTPTRVMPWRSVGHAPEPTPLLPERPEIARPLPNTVTEEESARRAESAYRRGLEEGEAHGRQTAMQQMQGAIDRMARSAVEISALQPRVRREAEEDVVKLSLAIAQRILRRELTVDPSAILGLAKAAVEQVNARDIRRVRVHPAHAAMLRKRLDDLGLPSAIDVMPDPSLEAGAAIFETIRGTLDASVETQLLEIERGLADVMGGSV